MKSKTVIKLLLWVTGFPAGSVLAQTAPHVDTIRVIKVMRTTDTAFHFKAPNLDGQLGTVKNKWNQLDSIIKNNPVNSAAKNKYKEFHNDLDERLKTLKKKAFTFNLTFESDARFKPVPDILTVNTDQKFVNIFAVRGTVQAWGVPLNFSYSSDRTSFGNATGLNPTALNNNLFKFDFDPKKYSSLFQSDLQQYYELKKTSLGGLDLTGYTTKAALDRLKAQQATAGNLAGDSALSKYLASPANMNALLKMNDQQMKDKLYSVAATADPALKLPVKSGLEKTGMNKLIIDLRNSESAKKATDSIYVFIPVLSLNISKYVKREIKEQPAAQFAGLKSFDSLHVFIPIPPMDISPYIKKKIIAAYIAHTATHEAELREFSQQLVQKEEKGKTQEFSALLPSATGQAPAAGSPTPESQAKKENIEKRTDSVATTISKVRSQLTKQGLDVDKMLQMQNYLNGAARKTVLSEQESNFITKKPTNGVQSLFTNVQALKFGAFGDNVPGNTANQDVFMTGASITFKSGNIPIAIGYGSVSDISAVKDANYQSSIYNASRNFTFLGTTLKSMGAGDVKIAVISSVNNQAGNSLYTQPTTSPNNVAITFTKDINMDRIGNMSLAVSKSNTLFDNKYLPGNEAVLDQKGGLKGTQGTDLLEAMSFGVTHHLDITELQASDNVYFNYSGMGYQNPGNNGYGGAKMKIGGNIKKAFYQNKLTLNLRTDITNMPISYTSNDKWKTYQFQLDSRYMISKKANISIKYTTNGTDKKVDDVVTPVYAFQKVQVDGNMSYKIGKNYTVSHLTIGVQQFSNTDVSQSAGNLLMFNYTQSVILKTNTLTATVFYNKEMSAYQLIGNMLTSDVGYTYKLFNKLNMSSAITYLSNSRVAQQAGVRQGVQLFATKQFDLDSYVDVRKNMITPLYPDLYSACRAELSLKYHIKN